MNWEQQYTALYEPLRGYIKKRLGPAHQQWAEDILHDIFLKIHQRIGNLREEDKFVPWMYRITGNTIQDYFRAQQIQLPLTPEEINQEEVGVNDITEEFAQCILPMISSLSEPYQQALMLTEIEGMSQKELAQHLQISYSGAKSRVQRGREKLKDVLEQCCDINADCYGNIIAYDKR